MLFTRPVDHDTLPVGVRTDPSLATSFGLKFKAKRERIDTQGPVQCQKSGNKRVDSLPFRPEWGNALSRRFCPRDPLRVPGSLPVGAEVRASPLPPSPHKPPAGNPGRGRNASDLRALSRGGLPAGRSGRAAEDGPSRAGVEERARQSRVKRVWAGAQGGARSGAPVPGSSSSGESTGWPRGREADVKFMERAAGRGGAGGDRSGTPGSRTGARSQIGLGRPRLTPPRRFVEVVGPWSRPFPAPGSHPPTLPPSLSPTSPSRHPRSG